MDRLGALLPLPALYTGPVAHPLFLALEVFRRQTLAGTVLILGDDFLARADR